MQTIDNVLVSVNLSIKELIKKMDDNGKKVVFVVDENKKMIGVVTDGDIRRWILKSGDMTESIDRIINKTPKFIYDYEDSDKAKQILIEHRIECIPVINKENIIIRAIWWVDFFEKKTDVHGTINQKVVIMAGGEGNRLQPFTKVLPKPLIPINDKTIVERIMNKFSEYGCKDFYMSINYKANLIKAYFKELELELPYNLSFVQESKPLGTAGSLYLLKDEINDTFFVINCDILIEADLVDILKKHRDNKSKITLVSSMQNLQIQYGVCKIDANGNLGYIDEKPELDFLVNTGMYILEPEVLKDIPEDKFYNITDLINDYLKKGEKIGIYPISEKSWMDMGQMKELNEMIFRTRD